MMSNLFRYFLIIYVSFLSGFDGFIDAYAFDNSMIENVNISASSETGSIKTAILTQGACNDDHGHPSEHRDCGDCHSCHLGHCGFVVNKTDLKFNQRTDSQLASSYQELHSSPYLLGIYRPPIFQI